MNKLEKLKKLYSVKVEQSGDIVVLKLRHNRSHVGEWHGDTLQDAVDKAFAAVDIKDFEL